MKKTIKVSGSEGGFKAVASRKKRKGGVLEESIDNKGVAVKASGARSWGFETGDTMESESIDMEEEYLVKETSVDYGNNGTFTGENPDQTPKSLHMKTKKVLGKPLGVIDYDTVDVEDDVLDDFFLLPPSLLVKLSVQVLIHKSFALDINLVAVIGKSSQKKLSFIRKIFSGVNGFGGASTPSKFGGIIYATFTSEKAMMAAEKLANNCGVVVNTDLKRPNNNRTNQAIMVKEIPVGTSVEAVCAAMSKFGLIKLIKMQLVGLWQKTIVKLEDQNQADLLTAKWSILIGKDAVRMTRANVDKQTWDSRNEFKVLLYTLSMRTNAHNIWDFIGSMGGKTCMIDCHSSAKALNVIMETTPVLKDAHLCWFCLGSALCAKCEKLGHTSLGCVLGGKSSSGRLPHQVFSDTDKSRLVAIYAKHSASIARPVSFGGTSWTKIKGFLNAGFSSEMKPTLQVSLKLNNRFAIFKRSLASLVEHVDKLAKRLDMPRPTVSQLSPRCQLFSSQNQGADIVISEGSGVATGGATVVEVVGFNASVISKIEEMLCNLSVTVMSLSAKMDNAGSEDIICWHRELENLVSIVMETKLRSSCRPWIKNRFNGVYVFTSGLDAGFLDAGVAIIMDVSLVCHVCKVSKMPGQIFSIKLLFKNKLSVLILGLYAVNFMIVKTVNESSFVILDGNFNKNGSHKCVSFRKCSDMGLNNSRGVSKTIDYVFVSSNLVNAIVDCGVGEVVDYFNTDHKAVFISVSLSGLLDAHLNSIRKQANKDCWNFNFNETNKIKWNEFKNVTSANAELFTDEFVVTVKFLDLDAMWDVVRKVMCLSANEVFKKKWFKGFNRVYTKGSSRFYRLEILVSKIVKCSCLGLDDEFVGLMDCWSSLDNIICSAFSVAKKSYCASKLAESKHAKKANIRNAINKRIDNFEMNKSHTIKSMALNHLVIGNELVLEPDIVKSNTRSHGVVSDVSEDWLHQYRPLEYVFDKAFSGVMCSINFDELFCVVSDLPDGKAAGLSDIPNELWKHSWVLIIPKPYEWEGVLTNTQPIALIETACKILSKILSNRISLAYSAYDVLHGDNFSVLKGTITQSPIFAIGSVIEDALEKMAISINSRVCNPSFSISGSPISIAKKGESHQYLGIFLLTEGLSRSNVVKAHTNVHFFTNLVLRKAVSDKQFLYLVSAVLHPIVSYRTQFSFIPIGICHKWDALIHKGLKLKSGLPSDFLCDTIHHSSFYSLKLFVQIQSEGKVVSLINFVNSGRILGCLFAYRFHDLQIRCWLPVHLLNSSLSVEFLNGTVLSSVHSLVVNDAGSLSILESGTFVSVCDRLSQIGSGDLFIYTDRSLSNLDTVDCRAGVTVFFEDIDLGVGVGVPDLKSFTLAELQAIVLALECVSPSSSVQLFSDSQCALDACKSELGLVCPDFCNQCWVEYCHVANFIHGKNLRVGWHKVKGHLDVLVSDVLQLLTSCVSDSTLFTALCKGFVFDSWFCETVSVFWDSKVAGLEVIKFVCSLCLTFRDEIWLVCTKHHAYMEKNGLILLDSSALISVSGLALRLSDSVVKLLGITEAFGMHFGFCKSHLFFSGLGDSVSVYIAT
ncbi:hypothetical protein G9A89_002049 [Geosiphon pyriformis]|nr:hypothetical protein G9A89_002049 [Geosiphon pyriformis]